MSPHRDDPEKMERMRRWLETAAAEVDVDPQVLEAAQAPLLNMISDIAHGPSRPGAPLTAFLIGVAAGRGADAADLAGRVAKLAREATPAGAPAGD